MSSKRVIFLKLCRAEVHSFSTFQQAAPTEYYTNTTVYRINTVRGRAVDPGRKLFNNNEQKQGKEIGTNYSFITIFKVNLNQVHGF